MVAKTVELDEDRLGLCRGHGVGGLGGGARRDVYLASESHCPSYIYARLCRRKSELVNNRKPEDRRLAYSSAMYVYHVVPITWSWSRDLYHMIHVSRGVWKLAFVVKASEQAVVGPWAMAAAPSGFRVGFRVSGECSPAAKPL